VPFDLHETRRRSEPIRESTSFHSREARPVLFDENVAELFMVISFCVLLLQPRASARAQAPSRENRIGELQSDSFEVNNSEILNGLGLVFSARRQIMSNAPGEEMMP
jgi:hypothetical protein